MEWAGVALCLAWRPCGPLCDVLVAGSIEEILPDDKTALRTCKWPLRRICFWGLSALLDVDALKGSKDLTADIAQALEAAAKANPWAFGEVQPAGYPAVRDGGEGGKTPTGSAREQFAAWAEQALK